MAERFDGALIMAGMKVRAERRDRLFQLGIVRPVRWTPIVRQPEPLLKV